MPGVPVNGKIAYPGYFVGYGYRIITTFVKLVARCTVARFASHHITSHGEDGCRPQWPLYPRNKYLYTTLLLTSI